MNSISIWGSGISLIFLNTKTSVLQSDHYYKQMNKEDVRTAESAKPFRVTYKTIGLTCAELQNMLQGAAWNNYLNRL
jgi:hypothetical protein